MVSAQLGFWWIRDVGVRPVDARVLERLVEEPARRPDEGPSSPVFLVARLLSDEHQPGGLRSLAEHGLRPKLPQVAPPAAGRCLLQSGQRTLLGEEICRRSGLLGVAHALGYDHSLPAGTPQPGDTSGFPPRFALCRFTKKGLHLRLQRHTDQRG